MTARCALALWLAAAPVAAAQTTAPPDTARSAAPPAEEAARALARRPLLTPAEALPATAFRYETGVPGGPVAVSWLGLAPPQVQFAAGPFTLNDGVTGLPHFDLVPLLWLSDVAADTLAAAAFDAPFRPFDAPRPLTEARYQTTTTGGLQRVAAVHAQTRSRRLFGQPGRLGVVFGYAASAYDGAYPRTGVHGHRALMLRAGFAAPRTTTTVTLLHARLRPEASGGLTAGTGASLFDPLRAAARLSSAERGTERTDLAVEVARGPLSGAITVGAALQRYTPQPADTLTTRYRYAQATADWTGAVVGVDVDASALVLVEHLPEDTRTGAPAPAEAVTAYTYSGTVTATRGRFSATYTLLNNGVAFYPQMAARAGPFGSARANVRFEAGNFDYPDVFLFDRGFGPFAQVDPFSSAPADLSLRYARAIGTLHFGPFSAEATAFFHDEGLSDLVGRTDADTARAVDVTARRAGVAATLGWRADERRGVYATAAATALRTGVVSGDFGAEAFRRSVPPLSGQAQVGARLDLFRHDLLADVFVRARGWTRFGGRVLHAPTGLFVLPGAGEPDVPAAAVVDVGATARVRVATLWLVYENALANTPLLPGVALVPGHPFDARRLRFGVFWPISD